MRANRTDGTALIIFNDPLATEAGASTWFFSDDPNVDLAVLPLHLDIPKNSLDHIFLDAEAFTQISNPLPIGLGSECYAVGLFRLFAGTRRNIPVVHTGNIALTPSEERIPVLSTTERGKTYHVDGYLVELTNLSGLSGSPVFVRPETWIETAGSHMDAVLPRGRIYLLGVWQGSWEGECSPELQPRGPERVPVGMGVVVPAEKLMNVLNQTDVAAHREAFLERLAAMRSAKTDDATESGTIP